MQLLDQNQNTCGICQTNDLTKRLGEPIFKWLHYCLQVGKFLSWLSSFYYQIFMHFTRLFLESPCLWKRSGQRDVLSLEVFSLPGIFSNFIAQNWIVSKLDSLSVCIGNPDSHFIQLAESRKGVFLNSHNEPVASVDSYFPVTFEGVAYERTVRATSCEVLIQGEKCDSCRNYRPTLRSLHSKWSHQPSVTTQRTEVSSHTNYRYRHNVWLHTPTHINSLDCLNCIGTWLHLRRRKECPIWKVK